MNSKKVLILVFVTSTLFSCKQAENKDSENKEKPNTTTNQHTKLKNPVGYFEIPVQDLEKAIVFYNSVFGFEFQKDTIDGNEMAFFPQVEKGEGISGSLSKGKTYIPSKTGTLIYFDSENIDETLIKVIKHGGKILYQKKSIGELGFVAEFEDCEGNKIALHQDK